MAILPDDIRDLKGDNAADIKTLHNYIKYMKEELEFWANNRAKDIASLNAALATKMPVQTLETVLQTSETKSTASTWFKCTESFTLTRPALLAFLAVCNNSNLPLGVGVGESTAAQGTILTENTSGSNTGGCITLAAGTYSPWCKTGISATSTKYTIYCVKIMEF